MNAPAFVNRFAAAFGRRQALLLKMAGLVNGEVSASGAWVTDDVGGRWLDLGSYGLHLLGHRHPAIVDAAHDQLGRMGLGSKVLGGTEAIACAEALAAIAPPGLGGVLFSNSGSEAVEVALRLARMQTGRSRIIALRRSYHGKTGGALAVSDSLLKHHHLGSGVPAHFIAAGDIAGLRRELAAGDVAAFIAEPVQGEGGIVPVDDRFLAEAAQACTAAGAAFVLDEIQTGLGRCGTLWAGASAEVTPDILLVGKALGGGLLPVAATLYDHRRFGATATDPVAHASSFSGGALACRVARSVVDVVREPAFLARAKKLGDHAVAQLSRDLSGRNGVVDIRGRGLMIGLEMASAELVGEVILAAAADRVLLTFCLNRPTVLRIYPPATIDFPDLVAGLERVAKAVVSADRLVAAS